MAFTHGSEEYVGQRIYLLCADRIGDEKKPLSCTRPEKKCSGAVVIVALTKKHDSCLFTAQVPHFLPRFVASLLGMHD